MKIFVSHATNFDFKNELYSPLKNSELSKKHELVFPYENDSQTSLKDSIRDCDLVVAEISSANFEQGLQLGWASASYVSTVCFYKTGIRVSSLLKDITESCFAYETVEEMSKRIMEIADAL